MAMAGRGNGSLRLEERKRENQKEREREGERERERERERGRGHSEQKQAIYGDTETDSVCPKGSLAYPRIYAPDTITITSSVAVPPLVVAGGRNVGDVFANVATTGPTMKIHTIAED